MKIFNLLSVFFDPKSRSWLYALFAAPSLIFAVYYIASASISEEYQARLSRWEIIDALSNTSSTSPNRIASYNTSSTTPNRWLEIPGRKPSACENQRRPIGSESLPKGIVVETSDLEMRPLWDTRMWKGGKKNPMYLQNSSKHSKSLLAMAVGIKQKKIVDEIVKKFMCGDFVVMLFHYDGVVNEWNDLAWSNQVLHVSATSQTKWWFAKRFLHPDVVAEYSYIFLWDEDLGVEHFDPGQYLSIVKEEGLEVSQPALGPQKSDVHYPITMRQMGSKVHRFA